MSLAQAKIQARVAPTLLSTALCLEAANEGQKVGIRCAAEHRDVAASQRALSESLAHRGFHARLAEPSDIERLLELEEASWAPQHRGSREVLLRRLNTSPATNLVMTKGSKVMAVLYMQRIDDLAAVDGQTIFQVSDSHVPDGRFLQLIAIAADASEGGIGSELRAFALHMARSDPTIDSVIAVTLARGFKRFHGSMQEYVDKHVRQELFDPIIGFHTSFGAQVRRLVHGYRPMDLENQGIGVLIEYDISSTNGFGGTSTTASCQLEADTAQEASAELRKPKGKAVVGVEKKVSMAEFVADEVRNLGYEVDEEHLSRGLLDLGLDSVETGALRVALSSKSGVHLPATFVFDHPSIQALSEELEKLASTKPGEAEQAPTGGAQRQVAVASPTQIIAELVRDMGFEVEEGDLQRGFMDIGLDSVEVNALRAALSSKMDVHLSPTLMFDCPSIQELAEELSRVSGETAAGTDEQAVDATVEAVLGVNSGTDLLADDSLLAELSAGLNGLLRAKATRDAETGTIGNAAQPRNALSWDGMTCDEVETVQRALIAHFEQPLLRQQLRQKETTCSGDRLKYLFCTGPIVDAGEAKVFRELGLLEESCGLALPVAQQKLLMAVTQFWCDGEVRVLAHKLDEVIGCRQMRRRFLERLELRAARQPAAAAQGPKAWATEHNRKFEQQKLQLARQGVAGDAPKGHRSLASAFRCLGAPAPGAVAPRMPVHRVGGHHCAAQSRRGAGFSRQA